MHVVLLIWERERKKEKETNKRDKAEERKEKEKMKNLSILVSLLCFPALRGTWAAAAGPLGSCYQCFGLESESGSELEPEDSPTLTFALQRELLRLLVPVCRHFSLRSTPPMIMLTKVSMFYNDILNCITCKAIIITIKKIRINT